MNNDSFGKDGEHLFADVSPTKQLSSQEYLAVFKSQLAGGQSDEPLGDGCLPKPGGSPSRSDEVHATAFTSIDDVEPMQSFDSIMEGSPTAQIFVESRKQSQVAPVVQWSARDSPVSIALPPPSLAPKICVTQGTPNAAGQLQQRHLPPRAVEIPDLPPFQVVGESEQKSSMGSHNFSLSTPPRPAPAVSTSNEPLTPFLAPGSDTSISADLAAEQPI